MKKTLFLLGAAFLTVTAFAADAAPATPPMVKNWTSKNPAIYARDLVNEIMAAHPELLSVTLHGTPPGEKDIITMFAGSFPDRIGKVSSPDDVDAIKRGVSIVDPKWTLNLAEPKVVVILPLREKSGKNIGAIVFAFDNQGKNQRTEDEFMVAAAKMRDGLKPRIRDFAQLFEASRK